MRVSKGTRAYLIWALILLVGQPIPVVVLVSPNATPKVSGWIADAPGADHLVNPLYLVRHTSIYPGKVGIGTPHPETDDTRLDVCLRARVIVFAAVQ